jgi:hypothetical protein
MKALIISFFIACNALYASHPIYIMLTHPRATGTAFEKVMRTHGELTVLHAPYLDPYLAKKYGPSHSFTLTLKNPNITFDDITKELFSLAETAPVFFKESGYVLLKYLQENPAFYQNPQVKIAILVRDPAKSVLSFYKKMPGVTNSIIGHEQLWQLYELLSKKLEKPPVVIDSDEFLKNPLIQLARLEESWNLTFSPKNLSWEKGYADDWRLKEWYVEVAESTSLEAYRGDVERLSNGVPAYFEISDEQIRAKLQSFYEYQNIFYQKLLKCK